jgi:hypothetical protein
MRAFERCLLIHIRLFQSKSLLGGMALLLRYVKLAAPKHRDSCRGRCEFREGLAIAALSMNFSSD